MRVAIATLSGFAASALTGCAALPLSPEFSPADADLRIEFPAEQQDRRQLPDGREFLMVKGAIANTGTIPHDLPTLLLVLRDDHERIVFSRDIAPQRPMLGPGESLAFEEAFFDVPANARVLEIGWKTGKSEAEQ